MEIKQEAHDQPLRYSVSNNDKVTRNTPQITPQPFTSEECQTVQDESSDSWQHVNANEDSKNETEQTRQTNDHIKIDMNDFTITASEKLPSKSSVAETNSTNQTSQNSEISQIEVAVSNQEQKPDMKVTNQKLDLYTALFERLKANPSNNMFHMTTVALFLYQDETKVNVMDQEKIMIQLISMLKPWLEQCQGHNLIFNQHEIRFQLTLEKTIHYFHFNKFNEAVKMAEQLHGCLFGHLVVHACVLFPVSTKPLVSGCVLFHDYMNTTHETELFCWFPNRENQSNQRTDKKKEVVEPIVEAVVATEKKKSTSIVKSMSSIVLDVHPLEAETDLDKLEKSIRAIEMEGLHWGPCDHKPVAFGVYKLRITMTVVDDLVCVDDIQDTIEDLKDCQSTAIYAFNKI